MALCCSHCCHHCNAFGGCYLATYKDMSGTVLLALPLLPPPLPLQRVRGDKVNISSNIQNIRRTTQIKVCALEPLAPQDPNQGVRHRATGRTGPKSRCAPQSHWPHRTQIKVCATEPLAPQPVCLFCHCCWHWHTALSGQGGPCTYAYYLKGRDTCTRAKVR